jgi:hypothetical protein
MPPHDPDARNAGPEMMSGPFDRHRSTLHERQLDPPRGTRQGSRAPAPSPGLVSSPSGNPGAGTSAEGPSVYLQLELSDTQGFSAIPRFIAELTDQSLVFLCNNSGEEAFTH